MFQQTYKKSNNFINSINGIYDEKSILSIFILSTAFLSTQSNATEYEKNSVGIVNIKGQITATPSCILQPIAEIQLPNVQENNFTLSNLANVEAKEINIIFENCTQELNNIKLRVQNQGKSTLENTVISKDNGSNVSVAILDTTGSEIDLAQENNTQFKAKIDQVTHMASYKFYANYKKPDNIEATPGKVITSLNFDVIYSDVADQG